MALTKITSAIIADGAITASAITDTSITAAKLQTTLDLTGKAVTVATATAGDNDTTVASTAFVSTAIANLADSAPSTLNTLNELAAALGDDANFSTTVTNSIALKAPLASPTFTGIVTADGLTVNTGTTNGAEVSIISTNTANAGANNPTLKLYRSGVLSGGFGQGGLLEFAGQNASGTEKTYATISGDIFDTTSSSEDGYLTFKTMQSGTLTATMEIDHQGNVGIGTTTPTQKLDVNGTVELDNLTIAGAQGTDGQVLTSTGSGINWEDAAGTTINNNAVNRIITGSGTANTLNGDANFTYNGTTFALGGTSSNKSVAVESATGNKGFLAAWQDTAMFGINRDPATGTMTQTGRASALIKLESYNTDAYIGFQTSTTNNAEPTERMRITSAGNVGIGTTSPSTELHVYSADQNALTVQTNTAINQIQMANSTNSPTYITTNSYALQIKNDDNAWGGTASGIQFRVKTAETFRCDANGSTLFNTTTTYGTPKYSVMWVKMSSGSQRGIAFKATSTSSTDDALLFFNGGAGACGSVTMTYSATSYNTSSDYRLKENVVYDWDATTRLKQLKPCRFNWISDDTNTAIDGFLAHEAAEIVPNAVTGEKDATKDSFLDDDGNEIPGTSIKEQVMDHAKLVPLLVKTIQELEARITMLEG